MTLPGPARYDYFENLPNAQAGKAVILTGAVGALMTSGSDRAIGPYVVTGNTLVATMELHPDRVEEFSRACRLLLEAPEKKIVIDLTDVRYVYSTYVGVLSDFTKDAAGAGKELLLKVGQQIAWIFKMAGLSEMVQIEITSSSA